MIILTVLNLIALVILALKLWSMSDYLGSLTLYVRRLERRYELTQAIVVLRTKKNLDYGDTRRLWELANISSAWPPMSCPQETVSQVLESKLLRELQDSDPSGWAEHGATLISGTTKTAAGSTKADD